MKSTCINIQTISDYLAGNLNQEFVSDIEAHLSHCMRCREQMILSQDILYDTELNSGSELSESEALAIIENLELSPGFVKTCKKGFQSITQNIQNKWQTITDQWTNGFSKKLAFAPVYVRNTVQTNQAIKKLNVLIKCHRIEIGIIPTINDCCHLHLKILHGKKHAQNCRVTLTDINNRTISRLANDSLIQFENIPYGECQMHIFNNGESVGETKIYTGSFDQ